MMKLNADIYSLSAIEKAARDYLQIAAVEVHEEQGYWIITFIRCKYDSALVQREFENYLIDLQNFRNE